MPKTFLKLACYGFLPLLIAVILSCSWQRAEIKTNATHKTLLKATTEHRQLYNMSCIPSSIELVLKYNSKVDTGFYDLQNAWKDKADGTFKNFDGKTIAGVKFTMGFALPRDDNFPMNKLFSAIDAELKAGRKVIISLVSGNNLWHIYVIDSKKQDGDYSAYSRSYNNPNILWLGNVKQIVKDMKGTDIMTYKVN